MNQSDFPGKKNPRFNENGQENPLDPGVSAEAVRAELQKIISSPEFRASSHLKDFIQFVVEETLNGHPDRLKEYSISVTDAIIDSLFKVQGLRVVARTSAFQYKGKDLDVRQIGKQLDVRRTLGGNARRYGDRFRINVQLSDTANGNDLWSESYERDSRDLLAIQREMSQIVTNSLEDGEIL